MPHGSGPDFVGAPPRRRLRLAAGTTDEFRLFEADHDLALLQCLGRGASGQQPVHDRRSRFLVDPREQLAAQRWARDRHQRCLGVAHSHPASAPVPSPQDRRLGQTESLMLILSASLGLRAWWLHGDRSVDEIPIQLWDTQNHA